MDKHTNQWVAAYYPLETISNPHSRAIMCLLFDKVINYFPVSGMACGGGSGVSDMVLEGDLLYGEEVIEAREEDLFDNIEVNSTSESPWGTAEEFDKYIRLQVTALAAQACEHEGVVPITDDSTFRVSASLLEPIDLTRQAYLQASILAIESLEIVLPPFANISDEDVLDARERLKDQLIPFRRQMLSLAPTVRSGLKSETSLIDIHREAKYIVQTQIGPVLDELKDRLRREKGKFWRHLLLKGSFIAPKFVLNYLTDGPLKATLGAIGGTKELAKEVLDQRDILESLRKNGGLGYLLAVDEMRQTESEGAAKNISSR